MSGISPLQRFLGLPDGVDNPFDLLGLTPESASDQGVRDALARRLERVARHAFGAGHEADEVRLALHAAAAQLSDPAVRALLSHQRALQRSGALPPLTSAREFGPAFDVGIGADASIGARASIVAFRMAALPLFLSRSGLNRRSRHRLVALAHAHGLDMAEVREALRMPSHAIVHAPHVKTAGPPNGASAPSVATAAAGVPAAPAPKTIYDDLKGVSEAEAARVARQMQSALLGVGLFVGMAALVVAALLLFSPAHDGEGARAGGAGFGRPDANTLSLPLERGAPTDGRTREKPQSASVSPEETIRALAAATEQLKSDPGEAAWRFEEAATPVARVWTRIDRLRLAAIVEGLAEFVHRAEPGLPASRRALACISAGAEVLADRDHPLDGDAVIPALWSVGTLTRLSRAGEATGASADEVRSRLAAAIPEAPVGDATFWAGVEAGLRAMIPLLPRNGDDAATRAKARAAWLHWHEGITAFAAESVDRRNALLLAAAELLVTTPPSPATDPLAHETLTGLLSALPWSAASGAHGPVAAQAKVLEWLDDARISAGDLAVVTEWLVARSDAPGVGAAMILPRDADARARATLRDRYSALWRPPASTPEPSRDSAKTVQPSPSLVAWSKAADSEVRRAVNVTLKAESLKHACALARLNQAGVHLWRGDTPASDAILASPADTARGAKGATGSDAPAFGAPSANDGAWALRYLSSSSTLAARLEAMAALDRNEAALGPVDADVLAEAALLDSSADVRERAARIVRRRANEATVVNGLLSAIPAAPRRATTTSLLSDITGRQFPSPNDPSWPLVARRALADRLLEIVAGAGEYSIADALSDALTTAYRGQLEPRAAAGSAADSAQRPPRPGEGATAAVEALWQERLGEAERTLTGADADAIAAIVRKRDGRLSLAAGPIQRFATTQAGVMELTARMTAAERPGQRAQIDQILAEAAERRRRAANIAAQIEATERALLQVWMVRLGDAGAGSVEARP